jgi:hypothetical protein
MRGNKSKQRRSPVPGGKPSRAAKDLANAAIAAADAVAVALDVDLSLPDAAEQEEGEEEEEEEEEEGEEEDQIDQPVEAPPRKRQRKGADTADELLSMTCLACKSPFAPVKRVEGIFCPVCKLIPTCEADSPPNRVRMHMLTPPPAPGASAAAAASGMDANSQSHMYKHSIAKQRLPPYESELRRLRDAAGRGPDMPHMEDEEGIPYEEAIEELHSSSYVGPSCERQPEDLTELIRTGKFKELSFALPRTLVEVNDLVSSAEDKQRVTIEGGELSTVGRTAQQRPLTDLSEFLRAVVVTILPTLFDRPRAMLDWIELSRSVIELDRSEGWNYARAYYTSVLSNKIAVGQSFGRFDFALWNSARASVAAIRSVPDAAPAAGGAAQRNNGLDINGLLANTCHAYNFKADGCSRDNNCRFNHKCGWPRCNRNDAHRSSECEQRPVGFRLQTRATGSVGSKGSKFRPSPASRSDSLKSTRS